VCGIAGRLALDGSPALPHEVETMVATIRHRGPDGQRFWRDGAVALGHARLAIIDLSAQGEQLGVRALGRTAPPFVLRPRPHGRQAVLLAARPALRRPNWGWLRQMLVEGRLDDADATAFAGVRQLPAAHRLVVDERGARLARFWDYDPARRGSYDYRHPARTFRALLEDSVRLRLRSDAACGQDRTS
jgi:asparagine synthetase B (glutamine-hydrolysing)